MKSMWTLSDLCARLALRMPAEGGEININLQKLVKGSTWESPLKGHGAIDPATKDAVQKSIMLERFQEEVRAR